MLTQVTAAPDTLNPGPQQMLAAGQSRLDETPHPPAGGQEFRYPPTSTLRSSMTFNLTPRWAVQWSTGYDFERKEFSDHVVQLQRDMHDWRAIFAFTQAPNGNFAFNFFIALKSEPNLKFDYNRRTYRPQ